METAAKATAGPAPSAADQSVTGETAHPFLKLVRAGRLYERVAISVVAIVILVAALYLARAFLVPLLIGILVSYALRPVVDALGRLHVPRALAAAVVVAGLAGATSWMVYSLGDEATALIEKLPEAARKLRQDMKLTRSSAPSALQNVQEAASELERAAADASQKSGVRARGTVQEPVAWLHDYALAQSALVFAVAAQAPIVLLLTYFLLASGDHFRRKLLQQVGPSLTRRKDALRMLEEIDTQVQRYLFAILLSNAMIAVTTWLTFRAMGVEQAGMWGVIAGVLHFVPYLGSLLLAIAVGVTGFLQFGTLMSALAVSGAALLIASVIGLVFMPWLQSRFARLNAAVLFIALLFFGWLWGAAGLLLGGPLVAIIKVICDHVEALHPAGELLGE